MAKITLTIEADDAGDLAGALYGLVNMRASTSTMRGYTVEETEDAMGEAEEGPDAGATQDAEPGERQRRQRRTKAQIAEDNARAAGSSQASSASATPAQTASPGHTASTPSNTSKPSNGGDPFGDQLKEVAAEDAAGGECTKAMVSDALQASIAKRGAPATQALLIQHGGGAKSLGQIDPGAYADVRAALLAD